MLSKIEGRLQQLWQLQEIDIKIDSFNKEIEKHIKTLNEIKASLHTAKEELKKKKDDLNKKRLKIRELENDIKECEEKIKKLVGQLYTVKTNQEYSALDLEIKNLKADKNLKEDGLLNYVIELDNIQDSLNKEENELKKRESEVSQQEKEIMAAIDNYKKEIEKYEKMKAELRTKIDSELLANYDRISVKKPDKKVLSYIKPLETEKRTRSSETTNSWVCGECNVMITMQELNMILMNKELIICRSCSRILDIKLSSVNDNQQSEKSATNSTNDN